MTSKRKWTKFFLRAGIPKDNATVYATAFNENQLSLEILPQINRVISTILTRGDHLNILSILCRINSNNWVFCLKQTPWQFFH